MAFVIASEAERNVAIRPLDATNLISVTSPGVVQHGSLISEDSYHTSKLAFIRTDCRVALRFTRNDRRCRSLLQKPHHPITFYLIT